MHFRKFIFRSISLLCALMLLVVAPLSANATVSGTLSNSAIGISSVDNLGTKSSGTDSAPMEATWELDGTEIEGTVTPGSTISREKYYYYKGANSILTLTNNLGAEGDEAILSFSYTQATSGGTITFSDKAEVDGNMVSATLKYGESVDIILTTASTTTGGHSTDNRTNYTTQTVISSLSLVPANAGIQITLKPIVGGSYTVSDGAETKSMGDSFSNPLETTYTLTATAPAGNYHFSGWAFNGVKQSDTSMTLTGVTFNADTTVEALYTIDPMYAIASPVGNAYVDDLVGFNSRYYHDTRNEKVTNSVQRANNSSGYYSVQNKSYKGSCDTQYIPTLEWAQSNTAISVSKNGEAKGEYESFATSHVYANMVSDVIRIYGKQDSVISFDYSFTCSGADENTPAVHVYVSPSGTETIANILSKGTVYGKDKTSVTQTLPAENYMYIYTNGYYHSSGLKIGGSSTINYKFTSTITNVKVQANDTRYIQTTTFKDNAGNGLASGKLAISGTNYAVGTNGVVSIPSKPDGQTMQLSVATVPTNYRLIGWEVDGVMHYTPTYEYELKANTTINPIFVPNQVTFDAGTGKYQYKNISGSMVDLNGQYVARNADATVYYKSLAEGFDADGEVVLLGNMTISGNFEIPEGEVLVVPCAMKDVISKDSAGNYVPVINKGGSGVYATLTVNGNMTVNGALVVAGQQATSGGSRAGSYGVMSVSSGVTVTVSSNKYLYGYGLVKGAGNILAKSDAHVHELCEVKDFPYPVITELLNSNADDYQVMPFNSYFMNTIEAKTTYEAGATLEGHLSITYDYTSQESFPVIGEDTGILLVKSGSVTKYFDSAAKQIVFRVNESASVESGSFTASIKASLGGFERTATVVSGKFFLPMSAGYRFVIAGELSMKHDFKMLPGSKIHVMEGGKLTIEQGADLVFYRLNDYDYRRNNSTNDEPLGFSSAGYPVGMTGYSIDRATIGSAKLHVDGDVIVKGGLYVTNQLRPEHTETDSTLAFKNYSYYDNGYNNLTGSGRIDMTDAQNSVSVIREHQINNQDKAGIHITEIKVSPIKGLPTGATADEPGQYVEISTKVKGSINDKGLYVWNEDPCADGHTEETDAAVAADCLNSGLTEGKHCSVCGDILVKQEVVNALGHNTVPDAAVAPSCMATGLTAGSHCDRCGQVFTAQTVVDKIDHTWNDGTVTEAATCEKTGTMTYACTYVNGEGVACTGSKTETIQKLAHTEVVDAAVAATCGETGLSEGKHCSACGEVLVEQTTVAALGHNEVTDQAVAPTCTATGLTEGKHCSRCGEVIIAQQTQPATGHGYTPVVSAPTCTEEGYTTYTCSACGDSYVADKVAATGHSYTEQVVAPTCDSQGYTKHTCACGDTYNDTFVDAIGHAWGDGEITTPPTCEGAGVRTFTCANDSTHTKTEAEPASGHAWDSGIVTENPTCSAEGVKTYTCGTCNDTYTEAVSATGHTAQAVEAKAPTCTEPGYEAGMNCSVCGAVIEGMTTIPATGHNHNAVVTAPTCTEEGYTTYTCACGDTYTADTVAATGHSETSVVTKPTCDNQGYTTYTCSVCGDSRVDNYTDATGHSYTNFVSDNNATCTEDGTKTATCDNGCGGKSTVADTGSAKDHDYTQNQASNQLAKAADCVNAALYYVKCDRCGASDTQNTVAVGDPLGHDWAEATCTAPQTCKRDGCVAQQGESLGHDFVNGDKFDATCESDGVQHQNCTRCTETKEVVIPATGHTKVPVAATLPTCTETGLTAGEKCSVCGTFTVAQQEIPATGHKEVIDNAIAPDCVNTGKTEGKHCETCGEILVAQQDISATGHTEKILAAVAPTCTATGLTEGKKCETCGVITVSQDIVDALGHTETSKVTAPTCSDAGYTTYTCSVCGNVRTGDEVEALGHDYNSVVTDPTCTTEGYTTHTCAICGHTYTDSTVEALKHDYTATVTAPTCTDKGYTTYICSKCSDSYVGDYVEATGHTFDETVAAEPATCLAAGNEAYKQCTSCNLYFAADAETDATDGKPDTTGFVLDQLSHSYTGAIKSDGNGKEATHSFQCINGCNQYGEAVKHTWNGGEQTKASGCETEGETTFTCTAKDCGATYTEAISATGHKEYDNGFCKACGDYEEAALVDGVYQIDNAGKLYWFAQKVNGGDTKIKGALTANVDLNPGYTFLSDGTYTGGDTPRSWIPIGTSSAKFAGSFDGQNHTIQGIYISGLEYAGLFGQTYSVDAVRIQNISVDNSYIFTTKYAGGIVAYAGITEVVNCHNNATVASGEISSAVGGIVGYADGKEIRKCSNTGVISTKVASVGGIVGRGDTIGIIHCYNHGTVTGSYAGGIAGTMAEASAMNYCYSTDTVTGTKTQYTGVLIANATMTSISTCYYPEGTVGVPEKLYEKTGNDRNAISVIAVTAEQFASGEVAWGLNNFGQSKIWKQTVPGDTYPTFSGGTVYKNQVGGCGNKPVYGYANAKAEPITKHTVSFVEASTPSCTVNGTIAHYHCSVCGLNFEDEAATKVLESIVDAATGHKLTKTDAKAATCVATGNKAYWTCGTCNKLFEDAEGKVETNENDILIAVDPNNHKWSDVITYGNPTNEDETYGFYAQRTCEREGCVNKNHYTENGAFEIVRQEKTPATCVSEGKDIYVVDFTEDWAGENRYEFTLPVDENAHDIEHVEAQRVSCTVAGWDAYDYCKRESCTYTTKVEISAPGHQAAEAVKENEQAAKCGVAGSYDSVVYCSTCKEQLSRESVTVPALTHLYETYVYNKDATANADGTETAACAHGCGETHTRTSVGSMLTAVARIGDFNYASLNDAIIDANESETPVTIVLLASFNEAPATEIAAEVTVDLNGKTITWIFANDNLRALKAIAADGFTVVDNQDGTYTFVRATVAEPETNEASIGSNVYATLEDAIKAAKAGAFINLRGNVVNAPATKIGMNVTIITNGYTMWGETDTLAAIESILADGYTVTGNEYGIYFVNEIPEEPVFVAEINGVKYTTVKEALEKAEKGDTVTMIADSDESQSDMIIIPGVTLDLKTYELTVRSLVGFDEGYLIGELYVKGGKYGRIDADNLILGETAPVHKVYKVEVLPIFNPNDGEYIFSLYGIYNQHPEAELVIDRSAKTIKLVFAQQLSNGVRENLLKGKYSASQNRFQVVVEMSWDGGTGTYVQRFVYKDSTVIDVCKDLNTIYNYTLAGYDNLEMDEEKIKSLKVRAMVVTDSGVIAYGKEYSLLVTK